MGLDIVLGVVVLLAGVRGWYKGFVRQAIPLAALVGCIYLADPVRELARPYAREYFQKIQVDVLDKILWWTSAVVSYLVTSGGGFWVAKSFRKKTYGEPEPNRTDQGAGFALGVAKGLIVASLMASAVVNFGEKFYPQAPFAEKQAKESKATEFAEKYHPAETLWRSQPVQAVVARVKSRGFWGDDAKARPEAPKPEMRSEALRTASARPRTLSLPRRLDPDSPAFLRDVEADLRREGLEPK